MPKKYGTSVLWLFTIASSINLLVRAYFLLPVIIIIFSSLHVCSSYFITGRDFNPEVALNVQEQVEKLILQATSLENLCQCFSGWCAFW